MDKNKWKQAQQWESSWHDDCTNSYDEETKQYVYANRMGLDEFIKRDPAGRIWFDFGDKSVIDIGGGPYSLLLKSRAKRRVVVDPLSVPEWVRLRYKETGIELMNIPAEILDESPSKFDIALIYNCLQHTESPEKIIKNVKEKATEVRIFEWINTGTNIGHLHTLHEVELNKWLGGIGQTEQMSEKGCYGLAYYGIFV